VAEQTPNYGLTKSGLEDFYDVEVQNSNMNIIDTVLKKLDDNKVNSTDLTDVEQTVTEHLERTASEAHGAVRREYVLFTGIVTTSTVNLDLPPNFASLNDFDEIIVLGTMARNGSSTWKHFNEVIKPIATLNNQTVSIGHEILFTTSESNKYWLHLNFNKSNKTLNVGYNRSKIGNAAGLDGTENAVGGVIGVKYD